MKIEKERKRDENRKREKERKQIDCEMDCVFIYFASLLSDQISPLELSTD